MWDVGDPFGCEGELAPWDDVEPGDDNFVCWVCGEETSLALSNVVSIIATGGNTTICDGCHDGED